MSTTFDLRGAATPTRAETTTIVRRPPATPKDAGARQPATNGRARGRGERVAPTKTAGVARAGALAWSRPAFRQGSAGFFACAILALSGLGLIYITQISYVARYGYRLSALQQQQAKLDRENQLLQYRLDAERTLNRANDIAGTEYKMQPIVGPAKPGASASAAPRAGAVAVANTTSRAAPQIRFVNAVRPRENLKPAVETAPPSSLLDRLWNRIVGVGVARAEGP